MQKPFFFKSIVYLGSFSPFLALRGSQMPDTEIILLINSQFLKIVVIKYNVMFYRHCNLSWEYVDTGYSNDPK